MRSKFKWIFTLLIALVVQLSFAQEKSISGKVSDASGALPGVNVLVKGTKNGTQTDFDGHYTLKAKSGDVLEFSYVGMKTKSVSVGSASTYNVVMESAEKQLTEVIVTGAMGIKKPKSSITSAVQILNNDDLKSASNPNAVQSLVGKVSGVLINTISSGVNPSTRIVIRGNRSISGNNQALVVIDNAISSATVLQQLPPDLIESVNVLKGSQGSALYGELGANGAIIVTTKRGGKGDKLSVSINSAIDFENVSYLPERQSNYGQGWFDDNNFNLGDGNGNTYLVPWENGGWGPSFSDPRFAGKMVPTGLPQADGTFIMTKWEPIKDNIKDFFKQGLTTQNGFTVNMGSQEAYSVLAANRQVTDFVVKGDQLTRNTLMYKGGKKFGNFSIDGNMTYISQTTSQTTSSIFFELLQTASNIPVGKFDSGLNEHHWTVYYRSPYWFRDHLRYDSKRETFNGIINLGYKVNEKLSFTWLANVQLVGGENQSHMDAFDANYDYTQALSDAGYTYNNSTAWTYSDMGGTGITSSYYESQFYQRNIYSDFMVNYNTDLAKDVTLKSNTGINLYHVYSRNIEHGGKGLDVPGWYNINNVTKPDLFRDLSNSIYETRKAAAFTNLDIAYKDYLFLNLTARSENASVLFFGGIRGSNLSNVSIKRDSSTPYFYYSSGLSFIPLRAFDIQSNIINDIKVYANYVRTSNSSAVAPFANDYYGQLASGFPFGNLTSYQANNTPTDKEIGAEDLINKEVGLNFGLFNNRITVEASYYIQDTENLVTSITTSSPTGINRFWSNLGDLRNKGYEIDLGVSPFKDGNFKWDLKASFTAFDTKITALASDAKSINLQSNSFMGIFAEVGEDFPLIKGTKYVRDDNGSIIVNANGNPLRTSTFEKLGKATPDYILGFTNSFEYKGIRLSAVADFRTGHQIYSETKRELAWSGHLIDSAEFDRTQGYVVPNSVQIVGGVSVPNTTSVNNNFTTGGYSKVLNYFSGQYDRTGEPLIIDASALRIRELSLSYSLPAKWIEVAKLSSVKIGVNARNVFVWYTKDPLKESIKENKYYNDPEATNTTGNAQGVAPIGRYPSTRTIGFSINLTF